MNRQPMRQCGKPYPDREAAARSKRALNGTAVPVRCRRPGCVSWHLEAVREAEDTGPDQETRLRVYERDGWACVCCGTPVAGKPHSVGHRKRRSQGGTNEMDNLLTFLGLGNGLTGGDDHHYRIDQRLNPHDEARGYTVRSYQDPALVSVMVHGSDGGVTVWLGEDGTYLTEPPEAGEAA